MPFPIQYEITSKPCSGHECIIEIEPKNPDCHGIESIKISYNSSNNKLGIDIRHPSSRYSCSKIQPLIENFREKNLEDYRGIFHASTAEYTSFSQDSYDFTKDQCTKVIADFINALRTTLGMSDNVETKLFNILSSVGYPRAASKDQVVPRTQAQPHSHREQGIFSSSKPRSLERVKAATRAEERRKQEERDMESYSNWLGAGN